MNEVILGIIRGLIYPDPILVFGLMLMMFLDLVSGVRKANKWGKATSSRGLRDTIDKAKNYCTLILTVLVIVNVIGLSRSTDGYDFAFDISINGLVFGCIYIETKSILENLIILNTKDGVQNEFCSKLLVPLHNIIIFKFSSTLTNKPLS